MRLIFAGTPEFAVAPLHALHQNGHEIVAVFTQPDRKSGRGKKLTKPPVKDYAEKIGVTVHQPTSLKDQAELIASLQADAMIVVAYGMLLPQSILDIPPLGCINVHASILPRWRGAAPIQRAIEAGDLQTGVSIMRMELGLDTGPVFKTLTIDISRDDTSASLHDKLASLGAQGICDTLNELTNNSGLTPIAQDNTQTNYAKKISKAESEIDWTLSAAFLQQQCRAFIPWPISQTVHNGTRLRIWQASAINRSHSAEIGSIINIDDQGLEVACGEGVLRLEKLQRDGSKPMNYADLKNGYTINIGDSLMPTQGQS
jgi:methionyl-tRNA formyltransferase